MSSMRTMLLAALCSAIPAAVFAQAAAPAPGRTQLVVLGTGTPVPSPDRSGPSVAVVVNGSAYLVDFGPGVVRRAAAAFREKHIEALRPANLKIAFCTHLHSDHTAGLSDLFLTPAVIGRGAPLELYGPPGLEDMAKHVRAAYAKDIDLRIHGLERGNPSAYRSNVHEIKPGVVYKDANVMVTAFAVPHGSWDYSYGYRFDTADRSIVISGDTGPNESVAKACHGCDLMLHEVYSAKWFKQQSEADQKYHSRFHTSTVELVAIANTGKPAQLVMYHQLFLPGDDPDKVLLEEIRKAGYAGRATSAHDLDVY
ncbi:MAG TPA: MBL fold metallo-hydrolase [Candidatus Angelobacter sp.]